MGARRSHAELISEFHRLCDIFDSMDDCAYIGHVDPERFGGFRWGPYPREKALAWVAAKTATPSQIVSSVREALNDCSLGLLNVLRRDPVRFQTVIERYRSQTGREYFSDAGHPKKLLKALLNCSRLTDEAEYRLLEAFFSDFSDSMTEDERRKGEALMATYQPRTE